MDGERQMSKKVKFKALLLKEQDIYLKRLVRHEYTKANISIHKRVITQYIDTFSSSYDLSIPPNINEAKSILPKVLEKVGSNKKYSKTILKAYLTHLRNKKALVKCPPISELSDKNYYEREKLVIDYGDFLLRYKSLTKDSLKASKSTFRVFLRYKFGEGPLNLARINREDLVDFLKQRGQTAPGQKSPGSHIKNFCSFLFWAGHIQTDLAKFVPRTKLQISRKLHRYLDDNQIEMILNAVASHPTLGIRDHAMCLLMAKLGLRSCEILRLELEDLDFKNMILSVKGKGDYIDDMPITKEVLNALENYIYNFRKGKSKYVFVSVIPPFKELTDRGVLQLAISEACLKTGIYPGTEYVGSHVFRHSAATSLLEKGASFEIISNFLRHRSRSSTSIYAKVSLAQLKGLAQDIPRALD